MLSGNIAPRDPRVDKRKVSIGASTTSGDLGRALRAELNDVGM